MTEFRLNHLEALHWLWVVAMIAAAGAIGLQLRHRALLRFATAGLLDRLSPAASTARRRLRVILPVLAGLSMVAALLDPRWGVSYQQVPQRGVDVVIVLDVSRSMLAADATPSRLERARLLIGDLVDQLAGDRAALVTFAGSAALTCPLTVDYGAFRLALEEATCESAAMGGSLLGDALRVAGGAFTDEVPDHKVIVVFSDGEDHGSYAVEAAARIREERSIPIYTVGIGDEGEGARIPVETGGRRGWLTYEGQEVRSIMDADLLRRVADAAGGAFVPVGTETVEMARLYEERIAPVAKRQVETTTIKRHHAQYQWFAGLALLLLLVDSWIGERRRIRDPFPLAAAALCVALFAGAAPTPRPGDAPTARLARQAAEAGRWEEALRHWESLRRNHPESPELSYNMGVAAYRLGDLERAAELFREAAAAAADPALRARSAYNLGTTEFQRASGSGPGPKDPAAAAAGAAGLDEASRRVADALDQFRRALDQDPGDEDARANGELAQQLLERLQQLKQSLQQQGQQQSGQEQGQQDQEQDQQQQQQQQGGQDQQPPQDDQQAQGEQGQEQGPKEQEQQAGAPQAQEEQAEQEQEQEQGPQQQQEGAEPQETDSAAGETSEQGQTGPGATDQEARDDRKPLSRQEAERLLQGVRDKERRRRDQEVRRQQARQPKVEKDW